MNPDKKIDLFQMFVAKEEERNRFTITGELEGMLDYCEYSIRGQYDKSSKKKYRFKKRKGAVSEDFMRAFGQLNREEKVKYYIKNMAYVVRIGSQNYRPPIIKDTSLEGTCYMRSYNIKRWKKKTIRLNQINQILYSQRDNTIKEYNLGDYLYRVSKNNEYYSFVLQAINNNTHEKAKTVHIGFQEIQEIKKWSQAIQICIDFRHWQRIYLEIVKAPAPRVTVSSICRSSQISQGQNQSMKQVREIEKKKQKQTVKTIQVKQQQQTKQTAQNTEQKKQQQVFYSQQNSFTESMKLSEPEFQNQVKRENGMILEDLVDGEGLTSNLSDIEYRDKASAMESKKNLDFFHKLFPDYELQEIEEQANYQMLHYDTDMRIMQHMLMRNKFKMVIEMQAKQNYLCQAIFNAICSPQFLKQYNHNVSDINVKTLISSENSAIMYMTKNSYNKLYRSRDFVFVRHGFSHGKNQFFIADKQIQNQDIPPFITIVRGDYNAIWGIYKRTDKIKIVGEFDINNQGYLNENQNTNLALKYLKEYAAMKTYVHANLQKLRNYKIFDINWDITKNQRNIKENQLRILRKTSRQSLQNMNNHNQFFQIDVQSKQSTDRMMIPISDKKMQKNNSKQAQVIIVEEKSRNERKNIAQVKESIVAKNNIALDVEKTRQVMEFEGEINPQDSLLKTQTTSEILLDFDENGFVIIDQEFIKKKFEINPVQVKNPLFLEAPNKNTHPIWKGDWMVDKKQGALLFINEKKTEDQKGVLKFVLSKIGKNLLTGKSILNISLPVDIFLDQSNLQLFIQSMAYAPRIIEPSVTKDQMERFKKVMTFGLTMSPLYLNMEKPFNPILGQTFQGWINGCPAYAEQISHHPPISALYMVGRGYRISAQLEAKVQLHMNSGCGTNQGVFRIKYDDGMEVCFFSPGGEVSGLTYGERKFNLVGKAYTWIQKEGLFVQIVFNPYKKGFFSKGKIDKTIDYCEGTVGFVKPQFMKNFLQKKRSPTDGDFVKKLGKICGIWHQQLEYEGQILIDFDKFFPFKMEYEKKPLPSDCNWRQDIAYRRRMEIQRAQSEKQRLQVIQRGDRKLRQKFKKGK